MISIIIHSYVLSGLLFTFCVSNISYCILQFCVFLCVCFFFFFLFSRSLLEFSWCFFLVFFFFFPVQLALLLLILLSLWLVVIYIPLFFGCFVRGSLAVFQWRPVLLSSHFSQYSSAAQPCPMHCNPMTAACQASQSITNSQSLLRFVSTESVMTPNHLILSYQSPPAFNPSQHQGVFKWVSSLHQVAKVLEFQLQHQSVPFFFLPLWI